MPHRKEDLDHQGMKSPILWPTVAKSVEFGCYVAAGLLRCAAILVGHSLVSYFSTILDKDQRYAAKKAARIMTMPGDHLSLVAGHDFTIV